MALPSQRPPGRRIQARATGVVNVPMRAIPGLPFPTPLGGRLMLVYFTRIVTADITDRPRSPRPWKARTP
jgi:hypothetical protein